MKNLIALLILGIALAAVASGCSAKHEVETERLTQGLADASPEVKQVVDAAMASIKLEQYEEAVDALAKLQDKELKPEEKQAVADVLVDIQNILSGKGAAPELLEKVQNLMIQFM